MGGKKKQPGKTARRLAKEQRRARRRAAQRQATSRGPRRPAWPDASDLFGDAQFLMDDGDGTSGAEAALSEQLMPMLLESEDLAGERELREMLISPMECLKQYANVVEEQGIDPASLAKGKLPDEERGELIADILLGVTRRVLTAEVLRKIAGRLGRLQERCTKAGDRQQAMRAALLRMFLTRDPDPEPCLALGLVRELVKRSIDAGFQMGRQMYRYATAAAADTSGLPLVDRVKQAIKADEAAGLFEKLPGLRSLMSREYDRIIEEGREALSNAELRLGLFTMEDILGTGEILRQALNLERFEDVMDDPRLKREPSAVDVDALFTALMQYVGRILTPERLEQARARIKSAVEEPGSGKHAAFLAHVLDSIESDELDDYGKAILTVALIGEIKALGQPSDDQPPPS